MEKLYVSQEGLDKMQADLVAMKAQRIKIAETIEFARSLGDLKENAEYHSAKEAQGMLHAKINDIEDKITRAIVADDIDIDKSKAFIGATVKVRNTKTKKEMLYKLVSPVETDLANGKISVQSPVGRALLGKAKGEKTVASVPAGDIPLKIIEISY